MTFSALDNPAELSRLVVGKTPSAFKKLYVGNRAITAR
jgi:hypothetical protein